MRVCVKLPEESCLSPGFATANIEDKSPEMLLEIGLEMIQLTFPTSNFNAIVIRTIL